VPLPAEEKPLEPVAIALSAEPAPAPVPVHVSPEPPAAEPVAMPEAAAIAEPVAAPIAVQPAAAAAPAVQAAPPAPPAAVVPKVDIKAALEETGLVMIETSRDKAIGNVAATLQPEVRLGRKPKPPVVINEEPLKMVETRK
jgi:ribonuclease E